MPQIDILDWLFFSPRCFITGRRWQGVLLVMNSTDAAASAPGRQACDGWCDVEGRLVVTGAALRVVPSPPWSPSVRGRDVISPGCAGPAPHCHHGSCRAGRIYI